MADKSVKIGLLGSGTVGSGVVEVLSTNRDVVKCNAGAEVSIKKVLVRNLSKKRPNLAGLELTDNIEDIINDSDIDIVVELMGGEHPAYEYMLKALQAGKHVVTANKDVIAEKGEELLKLASSNGLSIMFEASVGGGIPIVTPFKECLTANKITEVMGIVNGTTNYMLTKMTQLGADYDSVLKEAQEKGYAEADPTADVEGLDAARKAAILASLAFNTNIMFSDVAVEGISKLTPADIEYAAELGYVIKLLAIARNTESGCDVRVHPAFLPKEHPLASVNDVFNAIFVRGNAIGEAMFYGKGAGSLPTASAVVADIVAVARGVVQGINLNVNVPFKSEKKLCPLEETNSAYYVRLLVADQPGVLGLIATAFGECGVSLNSVIQTRKFEESAEIVAITHNVMHKKVLDAQKAFEELPVVNRICNIIRVEGTQEEAENV